MATRNSSKGEVNGTVGQSSVPRVHGEGGTGVIVEGWKVKGKALGIQSGAQPALQPVWHQDLVKTKFLGWFSGSLRPFSLDIIVLADIMAPSYLLLTRLSVRQ